MDIAEPTHEVGSDVMWHRWKNAPSGDGSGPLRGLEPEEGGSIFVQAQGIGRG